MHFEIRWPSGSRDLDFSQTRQRSVPRGLPPQPVSLGENQTDTGSVGFIGVGECMRLFWNRECLFKVREIDSTRVPLGEVLDP